MPFSSAVFDVLRFVSVLAMASDKKIGTSFKAAKTLVVCVEVCTCVYVRVRAQHTDREAQIEPTGVDHNSESGPRPG